MFVAIRVLASRSRKAGKTKICMMMMMVSLSRCDRKQSSREIRKESGRLSEKCFVIPGLQCIVPDESSDD
jgi:hypothetical protein